MEIHNNSSHSLIKIHNKNFIASPKGINKRFTSTTISHKKDANAHKSKFTSNKSNDLLVMNKEVKINNNLNIMNKNYKKDLFEKFSEFLDKKNLNYRMIMTRNIVKNFQIKKINVWKELLYQI